MGIEIDFLKIYLYEFLMCRSQVSGEHREEGGKMYQDCSQEEERLENKLVCFGGLTCSGWEAY